MAWYEFKIENDLKILKKIHPKADVYFMRVAYFIAVLLIVQLLAQVSTATSLLK
jgi:hypothetical protein